MIEKLIEKAAKKVDLSLDEMESTFSLIAEGKVPEKEIADLLVALAKKNETAEEITGAARAMRKFVSRVRVERDVVLDTCGTGGDNKHTFNISTVAAFVAAGSGITVAKHGNRSVSGSCGSADLLEAFGVNIDVSVDTVEKCINEIGIGFLFAPNLHPAMRYVQPVRKSLKIRTIFNVLGPLINPAYPTHQLLGVYDEKLVPVLADVLKNLGLKHAMVVWGQGGFDEVTTTGSTRVCEMGGALGLNEGHIKEYVLEPEKLGLARVELEDIKGGDVETNRQMASNVLKGMEGPCRDIVALNAGCCIYLAGRANTIKEGMTLAFEAIDSGAAIKKMNKLIEYTNP
ncbi:MAG TPA: anthranilate phosphoribosyltransferase [Candidatus Omnitrophica bacterium]|nr:anthranilate phosphoribosyltransferase [Candidatus Omnitrophota bacterium]